jgi:DNA polymerase-3 subunit epsilon
MRVLGLDFETTGLDTTKDRIIEVGAVLWDVEQKLPLRIVSDIVSDHLTPPLPAEIVKLTGLTDAIIEEFGIHTSDSLLNLEELSKKADFIVAHNGEGFDRPLLLTEIGRFNATGPTTPVDTTDWNIKKLPWIDTKTDLPFAEEPQSRRLNHLAMDQGFINPFQHRAVFDVLTMLRVMSQYPIADILAFQAIPFVTLRAVVSFDDKQKAKDLRYMWEQAGDKKYPKWWVKRVKKNLLEKEIADAAKAGFKAVVLEEK